MRCGGKEGMTLSYMISQQEQRSSFIRLFGDTGSSIGTSSSVTVTIYRKRRNTLIRRLHQRSLEYRRLRRMEDRERSLRRTTILQENYSRHSFRSRRRANKKRKLRLATTNYRGSPSPNTRLRQLYSGLAQTRLLEGTAYQPGCGESCGPY